MSVDRHAVHVGFSNDQVKVTICFDPGNIQLSRTFTSTPNPPALLQSYFAVAQKGTCILRRAQLLEFIISQPADRFRAISNIIGIQHLDNYELLLKGVRDHFTQIKEREEISKATNKKNLKELLGTDFTTDEQIILALNTKLAQYNLQQLHSIQEIDQYSETLIKSHKTSSKTPTRTELFQKIDLATKISLPEYNNMLQLVKDANTNIRNLLSVTSKKTLALKDLLICGQEIIRQWDTNLCPLCGQMIDVVELNNQLQQRLHIIAALSTDYDDAVTKCTSVHMIMKAYEAQISNLLEITKQIPELRTETLQLEAIINAIALFLKSIDLGRKLESEIPTEQIPNSLNVVPDILLLLSKKCQALSEAEKLTEQEKSALSAITLLQGVKTNLINLNKANASLTNAQKSFVIANYFYDTFVSIKKSKVQAVFDLIQEDIQRFYLILHPNDGHTNIKLKQPTGRRASMELKIDSFGHVGEDPRAFSSEGHLDSLGLCIFLAFVKKFNQDCSLVVLDDIVTTVDAKHRSKVCELLNQEFNDKQLFITTHDAYWLTQLRHYHKSIGIEGQFDYREIEAWDLECGPVLHPFKLRWETIREKITNGDRTVANEGRIYLEWVLKQICEATEAQVPFRISQEYVVGDLIPAAKNRLLKLVANERFKEEIKKVFQELESTSICANLLSHDNILADSVTFEEISLFCENVQKLYNSFTCPACGNLLMYYRDLAIIRCPNVKCPTPFEIQTKT